MPKLLLSYARFNWSKRSRLRFDGVATDREGEISHFVEWRASSKILNCPGVACEASMSATT